MKRYLTIAGLVALIATSAYAEGGLFGPGTSNHGDSIDKAIDESCTITYTCGTGATGTPPESDEALLSSFTPAANTCSKDGYVFSHYLVTVDDYTMAQDGVAKPGVTYTIPFVGSHNCEAGLAVTLTPQWVPASGTPVVPAKSYTDAELATRQPNFTGSATDKLILFSGTTDGAFGERAVVTSLGTPNSTSGLYSGTDLSSTEVPTNGAVNTGVNRKQATVSGTANYVAMYDENAHMTGDAKGIYNASSLTDLDTLVEAGTLNTAIVDAVNSELIQVGLDGQPSSSGVLWKVNTAANLTLLGPAASGGAQSPSAMHDYLMNLDGTCSDDSGYIPLDGSYSHQGPCDDSTLSEMTNGDWCTHINSADDNMCVDLIGHSACSTVVSNNRDIPENQSQINSDYATNIASVPNSNPVGRYCYCQLIKANGNSAVSSWVGVNTFDTPAECASDCANYCSLRMYEEGDPGGFAHILYETVP